MTEQGSSLPELSFGGEYFAAKPKRFQEIVVLVPFFKARKSQMLRHANFLNEIGFDAVVFDLKFDLTDTAFFSPDSKFGMKHVWASQIEKILSELPGRKILYAFSNPSASAIEAAANREGFGIAGLICDSGPSGRLQESMMNYYRYEEPLYFWPFRMIAAWTGTLLWSPQFLTAIHEDLSRLPAGFPILSIRGWKDTLISPEQIDLVFEPHHQLDWSKLSLPKAGHLNGLKDFRDDYVPAVTQFLTSIATAIHNNETD